MGDLSINENSNLETPNLDSIARVGALIGLPSNVSRGFDRKPRMDGYIKVFEPMLIGQNKLTKESGRLKMYALGIPRDQAMEFRLLMFRRIKTLEI